MNSLLKRIARVTIREANDKFCNALSNLEQYIQRNYTCSLACEEPAAIPEQDKNEADTHTHSHT